MAKELTRDGWEIMFIVALTISVLFTLGLSVFVYGLIKYAVKAANREIYNESH